MYSIDYIPLTGLILSIFGSKIIYVSESLETKLDDLIFCFQIEFFLFGALRFGDQGRHRTIPLTATPSYHDVVPALLSRTNDSRSRTVFP